MSDRADDGNGRQTFFDRTTHELRAPLSAILGYQELLADGAFGELTDEAQNAVEGIGRAARHLINLIEGVMDLSRDRAGELNLDLESVELDGILDRAADMFRSHAEERGIRPTVELADAPAVRSDGERVVRILDLVITAAVRNPAGHGMALTTEAAQDGVTLRIGPVEIETGPDGDDPGLRIAVAQRLARLLNGRLSFEPDGDATRIALRLGHVPAPGGEPMPPVT